MEFLVIGLVAAAVYFASKSKTAEDKAKDADQHLQEVQEAYQELILNNDEMNLNAEGYNSPNEPIPDVALEGWAKIGNVIQQTSRGHMYIYMTNYGQETYLIRKCAFDLFIGGYKVGIGNNQESEFNVLLQPGKTIKLDFGNQPYYLTGEAKDLIKKLHHDETGKALITSQRWVELGYDAMVNARVWFLKGNSAVITKKEEESDNWYQALFSDRKCRLTYMSEAFTA